MYLCDNFTHGILKFCYFHVRIHSNLLQIADLELHLVLVGGGILVGCMILRAVLTSSIAVRSNLNMKEKIFVGLSWMAKATVQVIIIFVIIIYFLPKYLHKNNFKCKLGGSVWINNYWKMNQTIVFEVLL